ncbi:MAG TPA: serine/threonine-protein kinase [Steroidobacteraceae bacterium]|jgi:serine/threonine-protein kinase|nr:serine/threonine-protein kinase [Steroidobacteraceae bacterium]
MSSEAWRTLSEHLDQALDLSDEERTAWLQRLRARDPELAVRVAELLEARAQQGYSEFLSGPSLLPEGTVTATLIGRRIGPYVIDAEIGRGGMGSVWRAKRDDGRFEGFVAVKFVHAAWIGQAGEQRFRIEGKLLGKLDHPNIARLLDAGMLDESQPYLVLEYVRGEPIDAYCARNALTVENRIRLFLDVLAAVGHAHSHLIVHRDLKPANIFVTREGNVKLLDFGIAKLIDADDPAAAITQSRLGPLTPQYAAPEQLLGKPVTTATDIYTLGLALYVCLTGTHPVRANTRSSAELLRSVLTEEPAPASRVASSAGIEARALKGDLDNVLAKALKKQPPERYLSAGAFADDLRHYLNHEPISAHADTVPYRIARFMRRHRSGVVAGALFTAALVAAIAFGLVQLFEAREQRDAAEYELNHANAQVELSQFLLGDSLGEAPREAVGQRLDRARELIQRQFKTDPAIEASLLMGLSGRYIDAGDQKGAVEVMNEVESISRRLDDPHLNADIACSKAQDAVEIGDLKLAHEQVTLGLANLLRLKIVDAEQEGECAMATAYIAEREGDYGRATRAMREAMTGLEKAGITRTSRYTSIAHEYARSLSLAGDYRSAWSAEQAVMAIVTDVGRDDSDAFYAMVNVGSTALVAGGQPKKSLELLTATMERAKRSGSAANLPPYLSASLLLARTAAGSPDAGGNGLMQAADEAEKSGFASAIAIYRAGAVRAALNRGDIAAAESYWEIIAPLEQKYLAQAGWRRDAQRLLLTHARLNLAKQDLAGAADSVQQAATLVPAGLKDRGPGWREIVALRAEIKLAQRQYKAAVADAQAALDRATLEAIDPKSSAWMGEALVLRARGELALGDKAASAASAREALLHVQQNLDPKDPLIDEARKLASGA